MNKIEKILTDTVKKMDGFLLIFGNLEDKVLKSIDKNDKILESVILSDGKSQSSSDEKGKRSKRIAYQKIRKKFKNKNVTYIVAAYDELDKYHRRFISDSLFLTEKEIYLFVRNEDIDIDILKSRYKRYNEVCEIIECRDGNILHIIKNNYKKNIIRDKFYLFIDWLVDGFNLVGDLFVS